MKNKLKHILLATALLGATVFVGCESIQRFEADHPIAYDIITGTSKALLLAQVPRITDDTFYQTSLNAVIDAAFLVATTPDGVAAELQAGVAEVYPNDAELQSRVTAEFAEALAAEPDPNVPASAPGARDFQLQLADALQPSVTYDYSPDTIPASSADYDETIERFLLVYHAPQRTDPETLALLAQLDELDGRKPALVPGSSASVDRSHWSDPLWSTTEWFSGVDSLQALKSYHSY